MPTSHSRKALSKKAPSRRRFESLTRAQKLGSQDPLIEHSKKHKAYTSPKNKKTSYQSLFFDYSMDYQTLNFRKNPSLYRVGKGEQGVLLVEPYKSEILPFWKFKSPPEALKSAKTIFKLFKKYKDSTDFVGMDMARKFLQMGYTRSRRYANHSSGRKYDENRKVLPLQIDLEKAESAKIFWGFWKRAEADPLYAKMKVDWKRRLG